MNSLRFGSAVKMAIVFLFLLVIHRVETRFGMVVVLRRQLSVPRQRNRSALLTNWSLPFMRFISITGSNYHIRNIFVSESVVMYIPACFLNCLCPAYKTVKIRSVKKFKDISTLHTNCDVYY